MDQEWITVNEVAKLIRTGHATAARLTDEGHFTVRRYDGLKPRVLKSSVEAYIAASTHTARPLAREMADARS